MKIARWAQSPRIRRVGALLLLGFLLYIGVTEIRRIVRVDACLDRGGRYDYQADACGD